MKIIEQKTLTKKIRVMLWIFIIGLVVSGLTAFPLQWEMNLLHDWSVKFLSEGNELRYWITKVFHALVETNLLYPFVSYGTDWLAFAHIVIAVSFIGPLKDPVRNIWVIEFGMIACLMVIPLALIAGAVREIPFYWRIIDCSFGAFGILPLIYAHQLIKKLNQIKEENE